MQFSIAAAARIFGCLHEEPIMSAATAEISSFSVAPPARGHVKLILRAEGLALLAVAAACHARLGYSWWLFALLFLAPDISFAAYALGPKWGAAAYNLLHSTLAPLTLGALALILQAPLGEALASIWLAHIGFDRALGYGLKYASGFHHTHLNHAAPL
jgi:hypothetical protein